MAKRLDALAYSAFYWGDDWICIDYSSIYSAIKGLYDMAYSS